MTVTGPMVDRIAGSSRYDTAVQVASRAFPTTAPVVYLTTGLNYPDALAAGPAAAVAGGPLLLVPTNPLHVTASMTAKAQGLSPSRVVIVGGVGAVPESVVDKYRAALPEATFERIVGSSRYDTGLRLVADAFDSADQVYIATGRDFPDALLAAAVAGGKGQPVILVDGRKSTVEPETLALIATLGADKAIVVGGEGAVSAGIFTQLKALYPNSERLAGANRYATSAAINSEGFPGAVTEHYWATGSGFADALSGAVLAAIAQKPMYVVAGTCVPRIVATHIGDKRTDKVTLIGGTGALSADVASLTLCNS